MDHVDWLTRGLAENKIKSMVDLTSRDLQGFDQGPNWYERK